MEPIEGEIVAVQEIVGDGHREYVVSIRILDMSRPPQPDTLEKGDEKFMARYELEMTRWQKFRETMMNMGVSRKIKIVMDGVKQREW